MNKHLIEVEQIGGYWRRLRNYVRNPLARRLHIPFVSQLEEGAEEKSNDCGAACVAMLARANDPVNKEITVNQIFSFLQGEDAYLSRNQLIMALNQMFGIMAVKQTGTTVEQAIDLELGMIALIRYQPLQVYDRNPHSAYFKGQHFVVPFGYSDEYVYVHDPLWPAGGQYAARRIPVRVFNEAWDTAKPAFSSIVTVDKIARRAKE